MAAQSADDSCATARSPSAAYRYPELMRIALVSPYSWTYQGGVNRHVEALAEQFIARGDHVRVLAPWDPPDALSRRLHGSSAPEVRTAPDYLVPLARTIGFGANGAVSNLVGFPEGLVRMRRELRHGQLRRGPRPRATGAADLVGRQHLPRRPRRRHLPRLRDEARPEPHRDPARGAADLQPALRPDRRLRGRGLDRRSAGSAASTRSFPTASTSMPPRAARSRPPITCGCCSSDAPRSARACRSCCPLTRRWSSTCRPGSPSSARTPRRSTAGSPIRRSPRGSTCSARSPRASCGGPLVRRTSWSRPRSPARASEWS